MKSRNNSMADNQYNFGMHACMFGNELSDFVNDVDVSNTVDGKPVYYWINKRYVVVPLDAGYVALVNCTSITVQNLNLSNNQEGLLLVSTTNSTITGNNINANLLGVSLYYSLNNRIFGNKITNHERGVNLELSSNNTVSGNEITEYNQNGIYFDSSSNNTISGNEITARTPYAYYSIHLEHSSNNTIYGNNMHAPAGIFLIWSSNNIIHHNNFMHVHACMYASGYPNVWDNGCPSGGNYWSDHNPPDIYSGPYQNEIGSDGIGDVPYIIDEDNTDRYPLIYPYGYVPSQDVNDDGIVDIVDITICALALWSQPGDPNWNPIVDLNQDGVIDIIDLVMIAIHFGETY